MIRGTSARMTISDIVVQGDGIAAVPQKKLVIPGVSCVPTQPS
jgi:hypothetical protein